jgi:HEAT repeat protein
LGKTKKNKDSILIKICEALGRIKDPAAAPPLKKIAASKGFLSIMAQDPEVRAAAKKALAGLNEK